MVFLKKLFIVTLVSVGILGPILVLADSYGLQTAGEQAGLSQLAISSKSIPQLAGEIIGVGLSLVGIIFFLLMLYAGLRWMIAMGKSEDVQKAKDTLEAAAIGLVIILAAYAITQFVFTNLGVGGGSAPTAGGGQDVCITDVECTNGTCVDGYCQSDITPQNGQTCSQCCESECTAQREAGLLVASEFDACVLECQACKDGNMRWGDAFNNCTLSCTSQRASGTARDCAGSATMIWCLTPEDQCIEGATGTGCSREFSSENLCKAKQAVWCYNEHGVGVASTCDGVLREIGCGSGTLYESSSDCNTRLRL